MGGLQFVRCSETANGGSLNLLYRGSLGCSLHCSAVQSDHKTLKGCIGCM